MNQTIDWSRLESVATSAEREGGAVGVAAIAPNGERYACNGDRRFVAASTVKIPIMVEIYRQIDQGRRGLDDPYVLHEQAKAPGSGVLLHLHDGIGLTLNDLIYLMISISDNTATNILIDMAGMPAINQTIQSLGMTGSVLGRRMRGRPAQGAEQENWATPNDYANALRSILEGRAASSQSCERMVAMLERQQNARRIARYLPQREGIRWGSKTGTVKGVVNDAGFISTDADTLILAVYCENPPDPHVGEQIIGDVSRAAMQATGILQG